MAKSGHRCAYSCPGHTYRLYCPTQTLGPSVHVHEALRVIRVDCVQILSAHKPSEPDENNVAGGKEAHYVCVRLLFRDPG